ncbi:hypothetical protein BJY01DRAFT_139255 [Aspergillus pseudoustus]|uniref:Secreted protein n=1 Tax=Aspergillus pseudoustus TaxID=1810923 RepID=A0ABR4IKI9_9EURO
MLMPVSVCLILLFAACLLARTACSRLLLIRRGGASDKGICHDSPLTGLLADSLAGQWAENEKRGRKSNMRREANISMDLSKWRSACYTLTDLLSSTRALSNWQTYRQTNTQKSYQWSPTPSISHQAGVGGVNANAKCQKRRKRWGRTVPSTVVDSSAQPTLLPTQQELCPACTDRLAGRPNARGRMQKKVPDLSTLNNFEQLTIHTAPMR